ncbi:hypothetical protein MNBD_UNCLBAC01-270 [hydrothermal vent metagenome]|uniref:Glycosyltransferase RgtA/B/C/D-like domain-containing protein n=1 Tax=hydrothermal vent metagenome TaxID=652676 RepID=A0A3B1DDT0_9ZZZZ
MQKNKLFFIYCLTGLLFLGCFRFGLLLAEHKPLWNDEIYTQISSVSGKTYTEILTGKIGEGNISPSFYVIQKFICSLFQYQNTDLRRTQGIYDRIVLRINPVFFMSLSAALIFYYFSRYYSLWLGSYSIAIFFSSFMVWHYWAEARHYAFWVFLTTVQTLLFLSLLRQDKQNQRTWFALIAIHFILCFTLIFSAIQIMVASFLLWYVIDKHQWRYWGKYLIMGIIPVSICVLYYMNSPRYGFWFADGPIALLSANISKDRFLIIFGSSLYLLYFWIKNKVQGQANSKDLKETGTYCLFVTGTLAAFCLVLLKFKLGEAANQQGFQISNRYFIGLTPIGIIATTLFSVYLVKASNNKAIRTFIILVLAGLLLVRILRTMGRL